LRAERLRHGPWSRDAHLRRGHGRRGHEQRWARALPPFHPGRVRGSRRGRAPPWTSELCCHLALDGRAGAIEGVIRRHSAPDKRAGAAAGELCRCSILEGRVGATMAELHRLTAPDGHELVERRRISDGASLAMAVHARRGMEWWRSMLAAAPACPSAAEPWLLCPRGGGADGGARRWEERRARWGGADGKARPTAWLGGGMCT